MEFLFECSIVEPVLKFSLSICISYSDNESKVRNNCNLITFYIKETNTDMKDVGFFPTAVIENLVVLYWTTFFREILER